MTARWAERARAVVDQCHPARGGKSRKDTRTQVAALQIRLLKLDGRIGELMAQRVSIEEALADLYRPEGNNPDDYVARRAVEG
jgi:hypothetical protein